MPAILNFSFASTTVERCVEHNDALIKPHGVELAILHVAWGVADYAVAYQNFHGRLVGRDQIVGVGLEKILAGWITLLCGNTGRLDTKRLDVVMKRFAERHDLKYR